ncbi:sensor domain-containing diguanylate cyclase [Xylophilus sp. ASV27]|uniref:sensor domain-containing diguanylate cyclase n=1 Tax=Xylophilus sp. ASV27 TaxID=2795129 RepID=UPI0018EBAC60|nr:sensor domain-containing diguanylate cyclase [Xylophilus sp. ASV27]
MLQHLYLVAKLLDALGIAMYVLDTDDQAVLWNNSFLRFFPEHDGAVHVGEPYRENLRRFYVLRAPDESAEQIERWIADGVRRHRTQTQPFVFQHCGHWLRVSCVLQPDGSRIRIWHKLSATEAWPSERRPEQGMLHDLHTPDARDLLENVGQGALVVDEQDRILFANDQFVSMYGFATKAAVIGRSYAELIMALWSDADAEERAVRAQDVAAALRDGSRFLGAPYEVPLPKGRWMRVTANRTASGNSYALHSDISAGKQYEAALRGAERQAREREAQLRELTDQLRSETRLDPLTGLANRRSLHGQMQELALNAGPHSLLFIDLDGFKAVNDQAGHAAGDQVLRQVADRLRQVVRASDIVVRLGGDEFVVLLRDAGTAQARAVALKIVQTLGSDAFDADGLRFHVGASVGVRTFCGPSEDPESLVRDADVACYRAKRKGRGCVELHPSGGGVAGTVCVEQP